MKEKCFILGCFFISFISLIMGCSKNNYSNNIKGKLSTQKQIVNYLGKNFDKYSERILNETGYHGSIVKEQNDDGQNEEFIEFNVDDLTQIKFGEEGSYKITRKLNTINGANVNGQIIISLFGLKSDDKIDVQLKWTGNVEGGISCKYRANDIEHPLPDQKERDERINSQIKLNISTEEIEELISKAHSIYGVFQEIAEEYNKSLE